MTNWMSLEIWNEHLLGNLSLFFLYYLIFLSVAKRLLWNSTARNLFSASVTSVIFLFSLSFIQAYRAPAWNHHTLEALWHYACAVPGFLYLFLRRRQAFVLGDDDKLKAYTKFNKIKDDFLSIASHELRTPLSVINGFAEILVREKLGPLNDEQKRRIRKILLQGQRLNRIIDDLLDLSRIRSGKIEVRRDIFDLVPVLKSSLDDHQIVCEQQKIQLIDQIPDVLPDISGDLERLTQVIVNLLNNAIKYTENGGKICLRAEERKESGEVRVEVNDNGSGIDAIDLPHIFEEFYRSQQHKKYSGTGLGLSIVKQLVEAQGGKVGVTSEGIGKGASFYFTIPVSKNHLKKAAVPAPRLSQEAMNHGTLA